MADELDLELELDENQENINKVEKRIKSLSEKVKLTSEERDELKGLNENLTQEKESISKERDFFKDFNGISAKYQGANEYQDKIWEKVKSGYDVEDATISILAKEGKYTPSQPKQDIGNFAGGSATTSMQGGDKKAPHEMSQDELRNELLGLEAKGEFRL